MKNSIGNGLTKPYPINPEDLEIEMETEHSPTPWANDGPYIDDANQESIADTLITGGSIALQEANAARIVACVNACEGVDTEDLTHGCYQKLIEKHVEVCFAKQDVEDQRDELLAALNGVLNVVNVRIDDPRTQQFDAARAAIAKAEGAR